MKRLRGLRQSQAKSQKDVATYINKTFQAYSMYERGKREPDNETLAKLAEYFGVSVDYLLGRDTPINTKPPMDIKTILDQHPVMFDGEIISDQDKNFITQMLAKMYRKDRN